MKAKWMNEGGIMVKMEGEVEAWNDSENGMK